MALAAAMVHIVAGPTHAAESGVVAAVLGLCGVIQAVLAVAMIVHPSRRFIVANVVASAIGIAAWWFVRAVGLPLGGGLWRPEAVSVPDLTSLLAEAIAVITLGIAVLRGPSGATPKRSLRVATALGLLLAIVLGAVGSVATADDTWLALSTPIVAPGGRTTTLTYCSPSSAPLAMDVTEPVARMVRPAPVVLYVHGGGGAIGDRQAAGPGASLANQDGALFGRMRGELVSRGFVVASIDYRLQPIFPWRAQIEDAKCAVRFLRANAVPLGIDPTRIGAWGSSEGGYLATMLGTAGPSAGFDVGQYRDQSSRVEAVIDMFGPSDFTRTNDSSGFVKAILATTFHGDVQAERQASSLSYVARGDPPFLILQGTADNEIPQHHSTELSHALTEASVTNTLVMVHGAAHGLTTPGQSPGPDSLAHQAVAFLADTLDAKPTY